jgi:hypothetical protein
MRDACYQTVKFIHIGDFDLRDQVPGSVGRVHCGKAGIFTQGRDNAFDVSSRQLDHHDAADHVGGTMIFQPDCKACNDAGCNQTFHPALDRASRYTKDACKRRDGRTCIDTQFRD